MAYIQLSSVCVITIFSLQLVLRPIEAGRWQPKVSTVQVISSDQYQQIQAQGSPAQTIVPSTNYGLAKSDLEQLTFGFTFIERRLLAASRISEKFVSQRLTKGTPPAPAGAGRRDIGN